MNVTPKEVISAGGGVGLAFISYPEIISTFETVPWVLKIIFFYLYELFGQVSQLFPSIVNNKILSVDSSVGN